ncbi:MAG: hypothetical protein KAR42_18020 [candidate division Zixibacteria bacterium]|nr:hypothetical protein [candidate division Zixibacteria bacterium]
MKKNRLMLLMLSVLFTLAMSCQQAYSFPPHVPQQTAFGEDVVGQLFPQFQGSFEYTVSNTDLNTNSVANGGTVTQAQAMAVVGTSTTTASTALLQSQQHAKYKPGLGGLLRFTALFTEPVAGTEQLIGIVDGNGGSAAFNNGFVFGYIGTTFGVHRFQNDVLTTVTQANWNIDTMGAGVLNPSGMTLTHTNLNNYQIRFQYLGAGAIRFYIEDDLTGDFVLVHRINYTNNNTTPSVHNPNFHHSMWVDNGATTSNIVLKGASYAYFIEGQTTFIELHQPHNATGLKEKTGVTTEVAIITIRNKTTYASKANFIDIFLHGVSVSVEASSANNLADLRLIKNTTLGGTPSWTDINATNSVVEFDVAGTTVTGGKDLFPIPLAGKNDKEIQDISSFRVILGPGESLTIAGKSENSAILRGGFIWHELF